MPEVPPEVIKTVIQRLEQAKDGTIAAVKAAVEESRVQLEMLGRELEDKLVQSGTPETVRKGIPATMEKHALEATPGELVAGLKKLDWGDLERNHDVLSIFELPEGSARSPKPEYQFQFLTVPGSDLPRVKVLAAPGLTAPRWLTPAETKDFFTTYYHKIGSQKFEKQSFIALVGGSGLVALGLVYEGVVYQAKSEGIDAGKKAQQQADGQTVADLQKRAQDLEQENKALRTKQAKERH